MCHVAPGGHADLAGLRNQDIFCEISGRGLVNSKPGRVIDLLNKFAPFSIKLKVVRPEHLVGIAPVAEEHLREIFIRRPSKQHRYTTFSQECYDDPGAVESFDLRRQSLREVPESIGQFTNLRSLELADNMITELPRSIGELCLLQKLDCSNNGLKALPETIGQLPKLTSLYLFEERMLESLPDSIGPSCALA